MLFELGMQGARRLQRRRPAARHPRWTASAIASWPPPRLRLQAR